MLDREERGDDKPLKTRDKEIHSSLVKRMKPLPYHLQPLTVALRVRPMNHSEIRTGARIAAQTVDQNLVVLMDPNDDSDDILRANRSREKKFYFDVTFSELSSQEAVYKATVLDRDIIGRVVSGYNCTVFAYGATGAGKTYTMLGTEREPGLMVLTLNSLFTKIQDTSDDMIYRVTMAYMEIYNEMIRDLLNPSSGILDLFEDSNGEIVVSGLLEVETSCTIEVMNLLRRGNLHRTVEPTAANKTSSRSHAILKVTVEQRDRAMNVSQEVRTGVLFMVDLAGSERAAVTQNRGKRMVEGAHINRSLLALANCINALGSNHTHYVNYRDSKLTRLLKDALGGNCKTIMIAHVSPASTSFEESRNTLAYAERGKKIKNKTRQNVVDVNYHITQYHYIIKELRQKIAHLESQLERQQSQQAPTTTSTAGGGLLVGSSPSAITLSGGELATTEAGGYYGGHGEKARIAELCALLKTTSQEEKEIRQELFSVECQLLQNALEYQKHSACIQEWQRKRASTDSITKDSQDLLSPIASYDSHVIQQPLPPVTSHDSHMTQEDSTTVSSTNKLSIMTRPQQLVTMAADELHSISPDSGTDIGPSRNRGDNSGNHDDVVMEPEKVSTAREEVATLVAEKQRLEALHRRLDRLLVESKTKMAETKQALSSIPGLLPIRKEFIDLLQHSHELEAASIEHNLAATLISLQLGRHESSIEQLLQHSRELMELVAHQRELIKGQGADLPPELTRRCSELRERQEMLTVQVAAERQLPAIASSGTQLPAIARLSAKLYNNMTGSKSNLFIDDTVTEPDETVTALSDVHLPLLESPRDDQPPQLQRERGPAHGLLSPGAVSLPPLVRTEASSTTKVSQATKKQQLKKDHSSSISLPPIDTSATPSLVGAKQFSDVSGNSEANSRIGGTEPEERGEAKDEFSSHMLSKKSDTALIVEAAKRARQNLIAGIPSPKKVLTKMTSFTTPRMSVSRNSTNKSKYIIVAASKTSVIDIEGVGEVPSQQRHDSIPCDQSRSHPHLGNSTPSKVLSPTRMKNSTKGNSVSFNKSVLSEATLRRVREGRTIITIDELEKITNRRTTHKSSSTHNTPLHQKHVQSPHHRLAGHSSTSLSKVTTAGQNASSSKFSHKSSPLRTKAAAGAGAGGGAAALHSNRPGGVRTGRHGPTGVTPGAVMRGGRPRKVNVRRTLPHPPSIRGRHSPMPRRQLIPSKVTAGNQLSKINSPYLTPVKLPKKQGTRDQAKKTKEWIN